MAVYLFYFVLVAVASADHGWKSDTTYRYNLQSRTMTGFHQVADQFTGIFYKATVQIQLKSDNILNVEVKFPQFAELHSNFSNGWATHLPETQLAYQALPLNAPVFELNMKNSVIKSIIASKSIPNWELNFYKSISSQLQIDTKAENLQKSKINNIPQKNKANGVYKTMEDSVDGDCETMYTVSPLQDIVYLSHPELAPQIHLRGQGELIDIVKTRNFSNCDVRSVYHFGMLGKTNWEPASNQMGNLLVRSSVSRVILSGDLNHYIMQSSVTTSKAIISPHIYNNQKGMVVSRMNLTLKSVNSATGSPKSPLNPHKVNNLVYEYDPASPNENSSHWSNKPSANNANYSSSSSSSSSKSPSSATNDSSISSSSSSNEIQYQRNKPATLVRIESSTVDLKGSLDLFSKFKNNKQKKDTSNSNSSSNDNSNQMNSKGSVKHTKFAHANSKKQNYFDTSSRFSSSYSSTSSSSTSSSSFSDSSSEEDAWLPKPKLNDAPRVPFLELFIANQGKSIQSKSEINTEFVVKTLAYAIGAEIQSSNAIPGQSTLTKFELMCDILGTMNFNKIEKLSNELFVQSSSIASLGESRKYQAWAAFRDAVAQAGTGPALLALKNMITSNKLSDEEAAQLVSVLPTSALYPTSDYLNEFFAMAVMDSAVRQRNFLNSSSILAFTELARQVLVNKATSHNKFPVHTFGRITSKKNNLLINEYIPKIAQMLKEAVSQADSQKIQVYSMALGNLAHPRILNVFEPYFEGKYSVSHFQRLVMVRCLRKIARIYPKVVRPILYRIISNVGELPEVRVIAVYQLMKTNPPTQILQSLAQLTNEAFQNKQVISAIQSAIMSAAKSSESKNTNQPLTMSANAAVFLLNPQNYGTQYSKCIWNENSINKMNLAYQQKMEYVGSDDGLMPSNAFYSIHRNWGGFKLPSMALAGMSSSLSSLLDHVLNQFISQNPRSAEKKHLSNKWSPEEIARILKMNYNEGEQIEANLLISALGSKRFFAIDNHTIEEIPRWIKSAAKIFSSMKSFNYSKFYNPVSLTIGFPTASGLPFSYKLTTPTLIYLRGEAKVQTTPDLAASSADRIEIPNKINASTEIKFVYSSKTQAQVGFVTPFNQRSYFTGLDKNIHINLPIRSELNMDLTSNKIESILEPLEVIEEHNIFEFSTVPYTTNYNILNMVKNVDGALENRRNIYVKEPKQFKTIVGQDNTGLAFGINVLSSNSFDWTALYNSAKNCDIVSAMTFAWTAQSIKNENISVSFIPHKSTARQVKLTASFRTGSFYASSSSSNQHDLDDQQRNPLSPFSLMAESSTTPDSQKRQEKLYNLVSTGINNSSTIVIDLGAEFQGQSKAHYMATFAVASSYVSPHAKALFFFEKFPVQSNSENKSFQVCLSSSAYFPRVPLLNFVEAMNADPTSFVTMQLNVGEQCSQDSATKLNVTGKLYQSKERKQFVDRHPLSQICKKQMQVGNSLQYACRNMSTGANQLDQASFSLHYENVSQYLKNITYEIYSYVRQLTFPYINEDFVSPNSPQNKIALDVSLTPDLKAVNISIDTPMLSTLISNLELPPLLSPALAIHPEYSVVERVLQTTTKKQYNSNCAVDKNMMQTFDNSTYPIKLDNCWHAMMLFSPKYYNNPYLSLKFYHSEPLVSILVRDGLSSEQKDAMIILDSNVINLRSSGLFLKSSPNTTQPNIEINGKTIIVPSNRLEEEYDDNGIAFVQYYALPCGSIRIFAPQHKLEVQYDGNGVQLLIANTYRSRVRGLCGNFDGEPFTDFTTPKECIIRNPMIFAATYAIVKKSCHGSSKDIKLQASQAPCFPNQPMFEKYINPEQTKNIF